MQFSSFKSHTNPKNSINLSYHFKTKKTCESIKIRKDTFEKKYLKSENKTLTKV